MSPGNISVLSLKISGINCGQKQKPSAFLFSHYHTMSYLSALSWLLFLGTFFMCTFTLSSLLFEHYSLDNLYRTTALCMDMSYCFKQENLKIKIYVRRNCLNNSIMTELIAPIILIVALFAINALVLFFIFRYRRRKANEPTCTEEELKTFSIINDGNQIA